MQRPDEAKRRSILDAATRLFAARPYHEVRLDDVAAEAHVGKGTLYIYFASKEELYLRLIRDGFAQMAAELAETSATPGGDTWTKLRSAVSALVRFGTRYPNLFRVMRNHPLTPDDPEIQATRLEVAKRIEAALVEGVRRGEVDDPHPELTTQYILSFVRGVLLYPPAEFKPGVLEEHIFHLIRCGIQKERAA